MSTAIPSLLSISTNDITQAKKILSQESSLLVERRESYIIVRELSQKNSNEFKQLISSMKLKDKNTLFRLAIENADKDIIILLIKADDRCLITPDINGNLALHYAIESKSDIEVIKLLINDKTIAAQNNHGDSPLHNAIQFYPNKEILGLLINKNNINAKNTVGKTPFQLAIEYKCRDDIINLLKKHAHNNIIVKF